MKTIHAALLTRELHIQKLIKGWNVTRGPVESSLIESYTEELNEVRELINSIGEEIGAVKLIW